MRIDSAIQMIWHRNEVKVARLVADPLSTAVHARGVTVDLQCEGGHDR